MANTICKWGFRILLLLYVIALAIGLTGTFGWFGEEQDPLSWVFVVLLGQPWVAWLDGVSDSIRPWLAALTPLINIILLAALCRGLSVRRGESR